MVPRKQWALALLRLQYYLPRKCPNMQEYFTICLPPHFPLYHAQDPTKALCALFLAYGILPLFGGVSDLSPELPYSSRAVCVYMFVFVYVFVYVCVHIYAYMCVYMCVRERSRPTQGGGRKPLCRSEGWGPGRAGVAI